MSSPINYDSSTWDINPIDTLGTADIPQLGGTLGGLTYPTSPPTWGNITIGAIGSAGGSGTYSTGGSYYTTNSTANNWATISNAGSLGTTSPGSLQVKGNAEFEGKVMINGRDISEFMETIAKRLSILVPDPEKLEHFEALKKAYNHYKTLEALCEIPKEEEDK